ncbi:MAG: LysM peptidoglycan-binding domain-containing protein [Bacteroidetes bacterium]|nr:LysM peptidoglycan-binding domain-containing protein [Bacteroidota bacterium]
MCNLRNRQLAIGSRQYCLLSTAYCLLFLCLGGKDFFGVQSFAQEVPSKMEFAGMRLKITEGARKKIQADVDRLTRSKTFVKKIASRADLYFPIIERIFKEKGIPNDFKFLSLQESSLISDAVSSSNAVGFWQFKKESAIEVGLRIDDIMDERMNIVASTYGASRYLLRNNFFFKNWIFALLSYNLGLYGAKDIINLKYVGAQKMEINKKTHWYVIRFLAYKIAFGPHLASPRGGEGGASSFFLLDFKMTNITLKEIAEETDIPLEDLKLYNKWLKVPKIPVDTVYAVLLPVKDEQKVLAKLYELNQKEKYEGKEEGINEAKNEPGQDTNSVSENNEIPPDTLVSPVVDTGTASLYSQGKTGDSTTDHVPILLTSNGLKAIQANKDDNFARLAMQGGLTTERLLKYNELRTFDEIIAGNIYYLQPKNTKAIVSHHTVKEGETLWGISQQYGVKLSAIRAKNGLKKGEMPEVGEVLWLRNVKPVDSKK